MSVITSMMQTGAFKRGFLIATETNTKNRSMKDWSVRPLFGCAATATAVEFAEGADGFKFRFWH